MTLPPITRTIDHTYHYGAERLPGVTGILKVLDKSDALINWAARQTAEAMVELLRTTDGQPSPFAILMDTVGEAGVIKAATSRKEWKRDEAAKLGSDVHAMADKISTGLDTGWMEPAVLERVERYRDWWTSSGWTLRLSEAYVASGGLYGGTFDLLARDRDGRTVLADIKTGKAIYHEAVLQLAAYGMADVVCPAGSGQSYPMPAIDRYVILHVTAKEVREVELNVGDAERHAFMACVELAKWRDSMKGKRL